MTREPHAMRPPVRPFERRALVLGTAAATCAALALVLWIKLRIVANVPRTAYAEPDEPQATATRQVSPAASASVHDAPPAR